MHQSVREPPAARLLDRDHRLVSIGMIALVALSAFEAMAVTAAMPSVASALDGLDLYALAFALPLATGIVGLTVGGALSDSRGPRPALFGGVGLFAVGLLIAGAAPSMAVLTLGRGVQGFGAGVYMVALYVVVAQRFAPSLQPRVFSAFAGAWVLPALVGPAIAGLIVEHAGWRWVFLSVPMLAVVALALLVPSMRSAPTPVRAGAVHTNDVPTNAVQTNAVQTKDDERRSRVGWSLVAAAAATALHLAGQSGPLTALALGAAALAALVLSVPRLLPAGAPRLRSGLPAVIGLRGVVAGAFVAGEVFVPLLLNRERDLSPGTAGLALTAAAVAWSAGSWWQGRDAVTMPRWRIGRYGIMFVAVGIATSALVAFPAVPVYVVLLTWSLAGLGMGLVMPVLSLLTLSASGTGDEGRNSAALQVSDALASTVALAVAGTVLLALIDAGGVLAYLVGFGIAAALARVGAAYAYRMAPAG